jgi:hypothetical protein
MTISAAVRNDIRSPDGEGTGSAPELEFVLAAVKTALLARERIEVPQQGIYVAFDAGVVATCFTCGVSWEVKRCHFRQPEWWRCPGGCRR